MGLSAGRKSHLAARLHDQFGHLNSTILPLLSPNVQGILIDAVLISWTTVSGGYEPYYFVTELSGNGSESKREGCSGPVQEPVRNRFETVLKRFRKSPVFQNRTGTGSKTGSET